MDYRNDKFQVGDIVRYLKNNQIVGRICKAIRMSDVDTSGRYDETYYWTEYSFEDGYMFKSYNDEEYELISKEIGPEQIADYDKVLVCNGHGLEGANYWKCDFAAGWTNESSYYEKRLMTISQPDVRDIYYNVLPYNQETKKLVGTNYNIPIYYHYPKWVEDRIKNIKENPQDWKAIEDSIRYNIKYK
jgi:hypothetical protein